MPAEDGNAPTGRNAPTAAGKVHTATGEGPAPLIATQHRHLVIRASAGSGKTYQLAVRYLRRLLDGAPPDQILASTFTRKAAGEILGRILTQLAKAGRDEQLLRVLAAHLGEPSLAPQRCLHLLGELAPLLNRLRVGTLDSFFARLATSYTLELGLPPGWQIIDELADTQLRRQAVEAVLGQSSTAEIRRLTGVLSRSDSGRRVSTLLQETVNDFYAVFLQTDRDAWHQRPPTKVLSAEQLALALSELEQLELPTDKRIRKRRDVELQLLANEDWEKFVAGGIAAALASGATTYYGKEIPPAAVALYRRLLDHAQGWILQRLSSQTAAVYEILCAFDVEYTRLKQRARGLRFEDVTRRLAEAFGTQGESAQVLQHLAYRLDSDVSHLLLDEFQDTSLAQWQVVRPFAEKMTQAREGTSLFAVGDVKQAIYGWRGGVAEIFDAIESELDDVISQTLATSYRSSQVVIDAVNTLFQQIPRHGNLRQDEATIREWCGQFKPHTTARDLPGHVTLETSDEPTQPKAEERATAVIAAAAVRVEQIAAAAPWASVGVLVRKNDHIAPLIAELRNRNVEASEESGNPLTDSAAVMLLLSLLQMADHPGDTIARFHVATSPLGEALEFTNHTSDREAIELAGRLRRRLLDDGYGATIDAWVRLLAPVCSRRDLTRLGQLVELAYRYQEQSTLRPGDFIRFVEHQRVQDPSAARVRVMTVHQAKGLQFDVVVLLLLDHQLVSVTPPFVVGGGTPTSPPDLVSVYVNKSEQPLLPPRFQDACEQTRAASIREQLCVLYVAVTRAIHALHMIVPPSGNEKTLPRNSAGLVRAALTNGEQAEASRVLYEHGEADWPAKARAGRAGAASGPTARDVEANLTVELAAMTGGRSRGLGRVAPSRSEQAHTLRLAQLAQGSDPAALARGSLIHAWFEQIVWLDDGPPDADQLRHIARQQGFDGALAGRYLKDFQSMLARPAVAGLLNRQSYVSQPPPLPAALIEELAAGALSLEVGRERPVAVQFEGELLAGTIDRLVLLRRDETVVAADIIDYKTDTVSEGGAADLQRTEHYRRQLEAYAAAVAMIYRLDRERITSRLLFVQSGELVVV